MVKNVKMIRRLCDHWIKCPMQNGATCDRIAGKGEGAKCWNQNRMEMLRLIGQQRDGRSTSIEYIKRSKRQIMVEIEWS